jgi:glycosyltransferase involved in cell wall biosynthesis
MGHRIGHFLAHYPAAGGMSTAVRGLSRALARMGHRVFIYGYREENQVPCQEAEEIPGLKVIRFCHRPQHPFQIPGPLTQRLRHNEDAIDLLVIHGMFNPQALGPAREARRAGIPYIVCPHDPYHPDLLRKHRTKKALYGLLLERPLLNKAVAIHLLSASHEQWLRRYGVQTPAFVVPNGFDPQDFPRFVAGDTSPEDNSSHALRLLYIGRIAMYHKGLDLLFRGFAVASHQGRLGTGALLDLVGSNWGDQKTLEGLASDLRIRDKVNFLGPVRDRASTAIISQYDVLVLTSRYDGFGLVVLEAMLAGRPVIVSREAGAASFVGEAQCGYVCAPNPDSIQAALVRALETRDQWREMGRKGRDFAFRHLPWEKVAERASLCYEEVLRDAKASA